LPICLGIAGIAFHLLSRLRPEVRNAEQATENIVALQLEFRFGIRWQIAANFCEILDQGIEIRVIPYLDELLYFPAHQNVSSDWSPVCRRLFGNQGVGRESLAPFSYLMGFVHDPSSA
jgi:hypothetical protein